jgi:phage gpG-like protein
MTPSITIEIDPALTAAVRRLADSQRQIPLAIARAMDEQNELTVSAIQREKLSGQVLRVRSNRLRGSIRRNAATVSGETVTSAIGSNVKYAAIHEYGGVTPPHVIRPRHRQALCFSLGGGKFFAKKVNHPGSKIPARPYIGPTISERAPMYCMAIEEVIKKLLVGGGE